MTIFNPRASYRSQNGTEREQLTCKKLKKAANKNRYKSICEKVRTRRGKGSQNDVEIDGKIDDKSMRFRNLRFFDFCEEYNVKLLFLHDQGHQKSIQFQHLGPDAFRGRVFRSILISFWEGFGSFWGTVDVRRLTWRL